MKMKTSTTWFKRTGIYEPERCLVAAIVLHAWRDVTKGRRNHAAAALAYFNGENFEEDCQWLNINASAVRAVVRRKANERNLN